MDADGSVEGAEEEPQVRGAFDLHQGPELVHFKASLQHINISSSSSSSSS
jgi:hypothetical protein